MAQKKERVEKALGVLDRAVANYEEAHPHWKIEVLCSLIQWSAKCLKHYIEDARDKEITWEQPFVELHYPIEWDWKVSRKLGDEHGSILYGSITDKNVADEKSAVKTLSEIMVRGMNTVAMGDLTNWVRFAKRGEDHVPCLPVELADALTAIKAKGRRQETYERIARPFSIGAALVDYGTEDLEDGAPVPKKVARQLAKLSDFIDIERIAFTGDVNGRKVEVSLIFQIHPLITDHDAEKAYHPITIGLQFMPEVLGDEVRFENPAKWPAKERASFWQEFLRELAKLPEQFIPEQAAEDSVILTVNAQLKVPASRWKPENMGDTMKWITDALAKGGELTQFQLQKDDGQAAAQRTTCTACGFTHDRAFTQFVVSDQAFTLAGALPDIVRCVHAAHEKGFPRLSTKDDELLARCGSYRNPCKAFYDLHQTAAYKALFDTSRRGFIAMRGFARKES